MSGWEFTIGAGLLLLWSCLLLCGIPAVIKLRRELSEKK